MQIKYKFCRHKSPYYETGNRLYYQSFKKETDVISVTNNACINWFVRTYFHQVIFYYYLTFSRLTPPNSKARPLLWVCVNDAADKPVPQVTTTPLPAVCGDPRGSRPRRSNSFCDWTAGRASDPSVEHLVVSHRRGSQWSGVTGNRLHSNADEGGQKRGELSAFLEQPGGSGLCALVRPHWTGIASPKRARKEDTSWRGSSAGADIFYRQKPSATLVFPTPSGRAE